MDDERGYYTHQVSSSGKRPQKNEPYIGYLHRDRPELLQYIVKQNSPTVPSSSPDTTIFSDDSLDQVFGFFDADDVSNMSFASESDSGIENQAHHVTALGFDDLMIIEPEAEEENILFPSAFMGVSSDSSLSCSSFSEPSSSRMGKRKLLSDVTNHA